MTHACSWGYVIGTNFNHFEGRYELVLSIYRRYFAVTGARVVPREHRIRYPDTLNKPSQPVY